MSEERGEQPQNVASPHGRSDPAGERGAPPSPARRRLLTALSIALGGISAALIGVPVVGFYLGPIIRRPKGTWRPVGPVGSFRSGTTVLVSFENAEPRPWAGYVGTTAAWLRLTPAGDFIAFSVDCTHLGCPVRWKPEAELFLCPCHGGVYYSDGRVAAGPPPHDLPRYPVRVRDGQVEIRTEPLPITTT